MYQTGTTPKTSTGMKQDEGKTRWDLLDYMALDELAQVLTMGAAKYEENNWQKVDNPQDRYFAALMRHLVAWRNGEKMDVESSRYHLAHVMANAMFLLHFDMA